MSGVVQAAQLPPEGEYKARLVNRAYGSDTWEIEEIGKPWHGYRFNMLPTEVRASVQVRHLTIPLPSGGTQTTVQGRLK